MVVLKRVHFYGNLFCLIRTEKYGSERSLMPEAEESAAHYNSTKRDWEGRLRNIKQHRAKAIQPFTNSVIPWSGSAGPEIGVRMSWLFIRQLQQPFLSESESSSHTDELKKLWLSVRGQLLRKLGVGRVGLKWARVGWQSPSKEVLVLNLKITSKACGFDHTLVCIICLKVTLSSKHTFSCTTTYWYGHLHNL